LSILIESLAEKYFLEKNAAYVLLIYPKQNAVFASFSNFNHVTYFHICIFTFYIYFLDCSCFLYKSTCCTENCTPLLFSCTFFSLYCTTPTLGRVINAVSWLMTPMILHQSCGTVTTNLQWSVMSYWVLIYS